MTSNWESVRLVSEAEDANSDNRRSMEDIHIALDNFSDMKGQGLFCVCDGHGGQDIVNFLKEHFSNTLEENLSRIGESSNQSCFGCAGGSKSKEQDDVMEKIVSTFGEVDSKCSDIKSSGSTVACCLIRPGAKDTRYMFVANVGDTRVVLSRKDGTITRLTYDHTATDEKEKKRIEAAGGFILRDRILGILSVARAIGDHTMKKYVISEPHTEIVKLTENEDFVIIACDGVWDVFKDEDAVSFIKEGLEKKEFTQEEAASKLVKKAVENGSQDNITVLVVFL